MSERPQPNPDPATAPYWTGASQRQLVMPQCEACEAFHFYPRTLCPHCGSQAIRWSPVSGFGSIYSMTVVHRAPSPAFEGLVPYVVGLVALDEGPHLMSNIVNCEPADVHIGQKVLATFLELSDGVALPVFEPIDKKSS